LAATPDVIITTSMDDLINTWDVNNGFKLHQEFEGHLNFVNEAVPYHGDKILSVSDDTSVRLWQIGERDQPGELLATYWIDMWIMKSVRPLPGQRAVVCGMDKSVRIISLVTGLTLHQMSDHARSGPDDDFFQKEGCGRVNSLLHLRNNIVVSGADDSTVRVWDVDLGKQLCVRLAHHGWGEDIGPDGRGWKLSERFAAINDMCCLGKDGMEFASCSFDRTVCIWSARDPQNLQALRRWKVAENGVMGVSLISREHIVTCAGDKAFKIWNFETMELVCSVETRGHPSHACRVDDERILVAGGDATIRVYNWKEGKDEKSFYAHDLPLLYSAPMFFQQKDERNWTTVPIMYQSVTYPENEMGAKRALEALRRIISNAMDYKE